MAGQMRSSATSSRRWCWGFSRGLKGGRRTVWAAVAFTLSGVAGLVYELVWTRYLALLVGPDQKWLSTLGFLDAIPG